LIKIPLVPSGGFGSFLIEVGRGFLNMGGIVDSVRLTSLKLSLKPRDLVLILLVETLVLGFLVLFRYKKCGFLL
jgi:hypothetical protein